MPPLISVIVPCYNLGAYIEEAIQSVVSQTIQDFEILVLDDGSTDEHTVTLLTSASWPRTQVFRTTNGGLGRARNVLLQRASGRFLCALDADDKLHPHYFEQTLAAFDAAPDLTFVSTRLQMFGDQTLVSPEHLRCDLPTLLTDCPIFSAALVRRAAVVSIGGYDERMPAQGNEDWDFWITLLERGYRGIILPDVLFYYRRRPGSLCDTCTRGETHLRLVEYLTRKHESSFHAHLEETLLWKDRELQKRVRATWQIQQEIDGHLRPTVARRRAELEKLRAILENSRCRERPLAADDTTLRSEHDRAIKEIADLRASTSWKITAPLRAVYGALQELRGRKP